MKGIVRIQDCVHGLMEFHGREAAFMHLLQTPELQRLRRIRQLGLGYFVYPGAEHSRFAHSLGAAYVAVRFCRHLANVSKEHYAKVLLPNETTTRDLILAAICHDLGHGPLSHAWEHEVIGKFDKKAWLKAFGLNETDSKWDKLKWHEIVTHGLILSPDGNIYKILENIETGLSSRISNLLLGDYHPNYLPRLLSSDIDVDRCDFILRDNHQTGAGYGNYDIDWLISTALIAQTRDQKLVIAFDKSKAPFVISQFLMARRALYEAVYFHKAICAAEAIVGMFLKRMKALLKVNESVIPNWPIIKTYSSILKDSVPSIEELLLLDDHSIWLLIMEVAHKRNMDPTAQDLARRLLTRNFFKQVSCSDEELNKFLAAPDSSQKISEIVGRHCAGESEYFFKIDERKNDFFATSEEHEKSFVYFANKEKDFIYATPVHEDQRFQQFYSQRSCKSVRLFSVAEAAEPLARLVKGK